MNIIPNLPILHSKKTVGKFVFTQNYLQSRFCKSNSIKYTPFKTYKDKRREDRIIKELKSKGYLVEKDSLQMA